MLATKSTPKMSVDQINKVDFISTSPDGEIMLSIADHLPWDKKGEHLMILQNKINAYLSFIESGQIFKEYPDARNRNLKLDITMKYQPDNTALHFLKLCKEKFKELNISFCWETI
jgi:hypothetical protein